MFAFERFNKRIKNLCRHRHLVHGSLAQSCTLDMATRFTFFEANDLSHDVEPVCVLHGRKQWHRVTDDEKRDLNKLEVYSPEYVSSRDIAVILGIHFRANEWGKTRCGSIVVTTVNGQSRYCVVLRFIQIRDRVFACVMWFDKPTYEYFPNTLVVSVVFTEDDEQDRLGCILPVENIIPTRVYVWPRTDGVHYNLMRDSGVDITSSPH